MFSLIRKLKMSKMTRFELKSKLEVECWIGGKKFGTTKCRMTVRLEFFKLSIIKIRRIFFFSNTRKYRGE